MADDKDRIWEWRRDEVTGKRKLVRVGPLKRMFRVQWTTLLVVATVVMCWAYVNTSTAECQAILHDPASYCPCMQEGYYNLGDNFTLPWLNDSSDFDVEAVGGG